MTNGRGEARRTFIVAVLLAFLLQGQLAVSHFHRLTEPAGVASNHDGKGTLPVDQKKAPSEDNCPLCQQLASAHSFLLHAVATLSLPELIGARPAAIFDELAPVTLVAFDWRSRAPPL